MNHAAKSVTDQQTDRRKEVIPMRHLYLHQVAGNKQKYIYSHSFVYLSYLLYSLMTEKPTFSASTESNDNVT